MAEAREDLLIVARLDNQASAGIEKLKNDVGGAASGIEGEMTKAEVATKEFNDEVEKIPRRAVPALEKTGSITDMVAKKFHNLGKAAIGIFAADVGAKVLGFNSALDLVNKASDGVAESLRAMFFGFDNRVLTAKQNVTDLAAKIKELRDIGDPGVVYINAGSGVRSLTVPEDMSASGKLQAYEEIRSLQARLDDMNRLRSMKREDMTPADFNMFIRQTALGQTDEKEIAATQKRIDDLAESLKRQKVAAEGAAAAWKEWQGRVYRTDQLDQVGLQGFANQVVGSVIGFGKTLFDNTLDAVLGVGDQREAMRRRFEVFDRDQAWLESILEQKRQDAEKLVQDSMKEMCFTYIQMKYRVF